MLRNNAAWSNAGDGFAAFGNPGALVLRNNTSFGNRGTGFAMGGGPSVLEANAAVGAGEAVSGAGPGSAGNTWDGGSWTERMVRSTGSDHGGGAATARRSSAGDRLPGRP